MGNKAVWRCRRARAGSGETPAAYGSCLKSRKCGKGCACRQGNRPSGRPGGHRLRPAQQWRRFTHRQVFFLPLGDFIFCCFAKRSPLPESRCILRPKRSALHPLPRIRGYSAAVQSDVFQGQGSALIETDPRAELVLPLDARLPVTLHRHSVKEACVLAIQRGILATTAECLLIFHCAERNEDKAGASSAPFSFPILHESYMATQKLLSEAFSLQEELWHQNVIPLRRLPQFP